MSKEQYNALRAMLWLMYVTQLSTFVVICFGIGSLLGRFR